MSLRLALRRIRKLNRIISAYLLFLPTKFFISLRSSSIEFSNNTHSKIDGVGAQIQRLLAIHSLSKKYGVRFHQNIFEDISVHALDPFQSKSSKDDFLVKLNHLFASSNSTQNVSTRVIEISTLSSWKLFRKVALNLFIPGNITYNIVEPYALTDCFTDIYQGVENNFPNWVAFSSGMAANFSKPLVSIHYRQGVGGSVIYPGQKIPRELPATYFLAKLQNAFGEEDFTFPVQIFTDAPIVDTIYEPEVAQRSHWEGTPGFTDGKMVIKGNDLFAFFSANHISVNIHSGGDPIDAIAIMSSSDLLITSRSSLSYVAGLLNSKGTIVAAEGFWHPAPSHWITH